MNGKPTPGPWYIHGQDIIGNEPNGYICTWSGRSANANLIHAAPDLLEALDGVMTDVGKSLTADRYEQAVAALSKARGQS